jgi:hypothetical protein
MRILLIFFLVVALTSCNALKKGLVPQKKSGSDEFLIEKKKPLVMPPDYGELPVPVKTKEEAKKSKKTDIKKILSGVSSNTLPSQSNEINSELKESILDKIKKNDDQ